MSTPSRRRATPALLFAVLAAGPASARPDWTFLPNRGQAASPASFLARSGGVTAHFEADRWTLDLRSGSGAAAVRFTLEGADGAVRLEAGDETGALVHSLRGSDPGAWAVGVPALDSVVYREVRPGVDVRFREHHGHLEYDLLLDAGADLSSVVIRVEGAEGLAVDEGGDLLVRTAVGPIRQPLPDTWEVREDGARRPVRCDFVLLGDGRFGFAAPLRDPSRPLVVDPGIVWSSYFGGTADEFGWDIEELPNGDFVVCGVTTSSDLFPPSLGAYQPTAAGGPSDVYLARFSGDGATLVWATYLGGADGEGPFDLELTAGGDLLIAGGTRSQDFPTTAGAYQTTNSSFESAFLTMLDASGSTLLYSTYFGGMTDDWILDVEVSPNGHVTAAGVTTSSDLPTTPNAVQPSYGGGATDVWLARIDPAGNGAGDLVWCTYLGGSAVDGALENPTDLVTMTEVSLHVDAAGVPTVLGRTVSADFPTTAGAFQTVHAGASDQFVTRLASDATALTWSTFVGGLQEDTAGSLLVDALGRLVVTGSSDSADFPVTGGAYATNIAGGVDGVVARLDPTASTLLYGSFLGGGGDDDLVAALSDAAGTLTLILRTFSSDFPIPPGAADATFGGSLEDAALCRFRADGGGATDLHYATYLGGSFNDDVLGGAWDGVSTLTCVGYTTSLFDYPVTAGSYAPTFAGGFFDSVVTQIELVPEGVDVLGGPTPDCAGALAAGVRSQPRPGDAAFALTAQGPPNAAGFWLLGAAALPTPAPVLDVELWLDPASILPPIPVQSDALGHAVTPLPIPNDGGLVGLAFHVQGFWPAPCAPFQVSATNALSATIQP